MQSYLFYLCDVESVFLSLVHLHPNKRWQNELLNFNIHMLSSPMTPPHLEMSFKFHPLVAGHVYARRKCAMSLVRGCPGHFPRRLGLFVDSYQIKIPHKFGACRRASCPIQPIGGCSCLAHPPVGEVVSPPPPPPHVGFFLGGCGSVTRSSSGAV